MQILKLLQKIIWFVFKSLLTTVIVIGLIFTYAHKIEPNWIQVKEQPVSLDNLPSEFNNFRIVQISDLHGKMFPDKDIVHRVNALNPDVVVITGDVFDEYNEVPPAYADTVLGGISAKHGVYFVLGNNDVYLGTDTVRETMSGINIKTLQNETVRISVKKQNLDLTGVTYTRYQKPVFLKEFTGAGQATTRILLAHRPEIIDAAAQAGIDLVLVGHTHGGQIRSPYVPRFVTVVKKGYEKYSSGLFRMGKTQMYVNRGLGVNDLPFRFLTRPEITVFTLHKG